MIPIATTRGLTLTHVHDENNPDMTVTIGNSGADPSKVSIDVGGGRVALVDREDLLLAISGEQPHAKEEPKEERPMWLDAEVIRADLDEERVFAVRDEDNDWLVLGGASDGLYVTHLEATGDFSNVEIVKV